MIEFVSGPKTVIYTSVLLQYNDGNIFSMNHSVAEAIRMAYLCVS